MLVVAVLVVVRLVQEVEVKSMEEVEEEVVVHQELTQRYLLKAVRVVMVPMGTMIVLEVQVVQVVQVPEVIDFVVLL